MNVDQDDYVNDPYGTTIHVIVDALREGMHDDVNQGMNQYEWETLQRLESVLTERDPLALK